MTNIEQKALALVNEVLSERHECLHEMLERDWSCWTGALCRAIERHEAFRQEVSDAVEMALKNYPPTFLREHLHQFIIPKPKPDPLLAAMNEVIKTADVVQANADQLRAALEARGLEIREKGQ